MIATVNGQPRRPDREATDREAADRLAHHTPARRRGPYEPQS
ncbi:hypothetical protein [Streptomyces sp. NPDC048277]